MGNIIAAGVLAFIILFTLIGYFKGLIKMVFSLASIVIILTLVTVLTPFTRDIIKETPIQTTVHDGVEKYVNDLLGDTLENSPVAGLGSKKQKNVIDGLMLPESLKEYLIDNNSENGYKMLEVTNFTDYLVTAITDKIIEAIVFVVLMIVVTIMVNVAIMLLDVVSKLPIIETFNKGGGAAVGFVEGLIIVWVVCIVLTAFSTTSWGKELFEEINDNVFLEMIYKNNLLENLINNFWRI